MISSMTSSTLSSTSSSSSSLWELGGECEYGYNSESDSRSRNLCKTLRKLWRMSSAMPVPESEANLRLSEPVDVKELSNRFLRLGGGELKLLGSENNDSEDQIQQ